IFQTRLRSGWLSALILTTFTCPAHSAAASSSTESRIRQGRLQAAENATRTGCFHLSTSDSKFASPISMISVLSGFVFISSTPLQIHEPDVFALFFSERGGRSRKDWTSGPSELTPSEPARGFSTSSANKLSLMISAGCRSGCRVAGFKLVFERTTASTNLTSPESTIGILFRLEFIVLAAFNIQNTVMQSTCHWRSKCVSL